MKQFFHIVHDELTDEVLGVEICARFGMDQVILSKFDFKTYAWTKYVLSGWPVYKVKCLCSRGQERGKEGCHSHQHLIFNSYDMKSL